MRSLVGHLVTGMDHCPPPKGLKDQCGVMGYTYLVFVPSSCQTVGISIVEHLGGVGEIANLLVWGKKNLSSGVRKNLRTSI